MKLRYLFSMILASALMLVSCVDEMGTDSFDNIKLDKTMLVIPENGGTVELKVNATEAWAFDTLYTEDVWPNVITRKKNDAGEYYVSKVEESWLSVDKMAGEAGETVLKFTADTVAGGREIELCIKAGVNSQFIRVRQGSLEASSATCAEVIAGADGKTYRVKGVCTSIANTQYGNWYLNDGTGEVYVYGTLDKDGKTKNYESWGMEVGDVVEVEGPKLTYGTTVELVDVTVIKIEKSLVKIMTEETTYDQAGGEFEVKVAYKGDGLYPAVADTSKTWISLVGVKSYSGTPSKIEPNPADTAIVTFAITENLEYVTRKGVIIFTSASGKNSTEMVCTISQKGQVPPTLPTIAEVRAATAGDEVTTEGVVMATHQQGFILSDATGTIYVYTKDVPAVKVGNKIKLTGTFDNYYGTLQIKNSTIDSNDNATTAPVYPTPVDLTEQSVYDAYAQYSKENPTDFAYVKIKGVLTGGRYITVGDSKKQSQLDWSNGDYSALNDKTVVVTAYMKGFNSKNGYYQLIETSVVAE